MRRKWNRISSRIIAFVLAFLLVFSLDGMSVFAEEAGLLLDEAATIDELVGDEEQYDAEEDIQYQEEVASETEAEEELVVGTSFVDGVDSSKDMFTNDDYCEACISEESLWGSSAAGPALTPDHAYGSISTRAKNLEELAAKMDGKFFTVNQAACPYTPTGHKECPNCKLGDIVKEKWFQDIYGIDNCKMFAINTGGGANSCVAFATATMWYALSGGNPNVKIERDYVFYATMMDTSDNRKAILKALWPGDHIRSEGHSMIVMSVNNDAETIKIIDSNSNSSTVPCRVKVYDKKVSDILNKFVDITRSYYIGDERPCEHKSVNEKGTCQSCGEQYLEKSSEKCNNTFKLASNKTSAPLREHPYDNANIIQNLTKNVEFTATREVINYRDNKWYYGSFAGGQEGYIYSGNLTKMPANPRLTSTGFTNVGSITQGSSKSISGKVEAKDCIIESARAYFCNSGSTEEIANTTTPNYSVKSGNPLDIGKTINYKLYFGKLPVGSYRYCVEVKTNTEAIANSGNMDTRSKISKFYSEDFTVKPKASAGIVAPTISFVRDEIDGKVYRFSQNTSGATLYYTVNGQTLSTSDSSYDVKVMYSQNISAYSVKSNARADASSVYVTVNQLSSPGISYEQTGDGSFVSISGSDYGATTYYSINNGARQIYYGPFYVTSNCTVTAKAERSGYISSYENSVNVTVSAPSTPVVSRDTKADIAAGDAFVVHWANDRKAKSYDVIVYKDGIQINKETITSAQYSYATDSNSSSKYEIEVKAQNTIGYSAVSNRSSFNTHEPLTVKFLNDDGSVIDIQSVRYGYNAQKPVAPKKRGYTFTGWDCGYENVVKDLTINAEYEINTYTVKFYDVDGTTYLTTQYIDFNNAIDSASAEAMVHVENGGREFTGWDIFYAKEEDSYLDVNHVDSNMNVRAVTTWANENLPVKIESVSATVNFAEVSGVFNGYSVNCKYSSTDTKDVKAKIIVTLLSKSEQDSSVYKMVNTAVNTVTIKANSSNTNWSGVILCDGSTKADRIEVSIVSVEGKDRTGGIIAECAHFDITEAASKYWSNWLTAEELAAKGLSTSSANVESKKQYRQRNNTKTTTTISSSTAPAGYTLQSDNSYWTGYSMTYDENVARQHSSYYNDPEWVSAGHTEYRYFCWIKYVNGQRKRHFCPNYSGYWTKLYADGENGWRRTPVTPTKYDAWVCSSSIYEHDHTGGHVNANGKTYWNEYNINGGVFYNEETRWVDESYWRNRFYYRDYIGSYTYYKWNYGAWGEWTDSVLTDSNTSDPSYEVETRTLYRYIMLDSTGLQTDNTGDIYSVNGSLHESSLAGKHALVMIYKSRNTDPTESQLEYVGETTLGTNGEYSFRFVTKEKPSSDTLDYVVALAVEGSDNLLNIDVIRYERPKYTVEFEAEGVVVSSQEVYEGEDAIVPNGPDKEGYDFVGWSKTTTRIERNTTVSAVYIPKVYCVAFVDYLNQKCVLQDFEYGTKVIVPNEMEVSEIEGYDFNGWTIPNSEVVDNMVVYANWTAKEYTVVFHDFDGEEYDTQTVKHGESAVLPSVLADTDEMVFIGWSLDSNWWNVTSDIDVYPVALYKQTTRTPEGNIPAFTEGLGETLTLESDEDATIYYTLDGSLPSEINVREDGNTEEFIEETFIYSGPISMLQSCCVTTMAVSPGKNNSDYATFSFDYADTIYIDEYSEVEDVCIESVSAQTGDELTVGISKTTVDALGAYAIAIDADPSVFGLVFEDDECTIAEIEQGTLCKDNGIFWYDSYEDDLGWSVHWSGDTPISGRGDILKFKLKVLGEDVYGTYPITVRYLPLETYGAAGEPIDFKHTIEVSVGKNGEVVVDDNGLYIAEIPDQVFTGSAIKPEVKIYDNNNLLKADKDYKISYKNNVKVNDCSEAGKAPMAIIKGIGNYDESFTLTFKILPSNVNSAEFTASDIISKYNGKAQKKVPELKRNGKKLKVGKDYVVSYFDESNAKVDAPVEPGKYAIHLDGIGNYAGSKVVEFIISANDPMSKAKVSKISSFDYTGEPICPEVTVSMGKKTLSKDVDYIIHYENNVNAGKGSVIISGIGEYSGTKTVTFDIVGIPLSKTKISGIESKVYSGNVITQDVVVTYKGNELVRNTDYTLSYTNNIKAGSATVTIAGKGIYSGAVRKAFKILPYDVSINADDFDVVFADEYASDAVTPTYAYEKGGVKPTVNIVNKINGKAMSEGVDYTVSYKNNAKKSVEGLKIASVVIKGTGNYKGILNKNFRVGIADISKTSIDVKDVSYSTKKGSFKSSPVLTDINGMTLKAGTDYDKNITYTYVEDTELANGTVRKAGSSVDSKDIVPSETRLQIKVLGKGLYVGSSITATYRVIIHNVADTKIVTKDKVYFGGKVTLDPEADEIRVIFNGKSLEYGTDYIISGYSNNVNKGTATVTIKGIGNYGGTKTATFKIGSRNFLWWVM